MDDSAGPRKIKVQNIAPAGQLQDKGIDAERVLRDVFQRLGSPIRSCTFEESKQGVVRALLEVEELCFDPGNLPGDETELKQLSHADKAISFMLIGGFLPKEAVEPKTASSSQPAESTSGLKGESPSSSSAQPAGKGKTGKGGRRSGRSSASWGEGLPRHVKISKTLTQILRHAATELGIAIRPDGFCRTTDVLEIPWLKDLDCKVEDVREVVKVSDKKRFELRDENGELLIRAVQGHSIKTVEDSELLRRLSAEDDDLPAICVHGTYRRHVESILSKGLLAGGDHGHSFRNHIHFAPYEPGDHRTISGMRYDCEVALYIDLRKCLLDGIAFYMSVNEVILSSGQDGCLHPRYFLHVKDIWTGEDLLHPNAPEPVMESGVAPAPQFPPTMVMQGMQGFGSTITPPVMPGPPCAVQPR